MIGVLAVLSVLALALAPVLIRRIDQAARTRDAAELNGMADAAQKVILRTGVIPDLANLVSALANEMAVTSNKVSLGVRRVPRAILVDPDFWINGGLPYTQSAVPRGTGTNIGGVDLPGRNLRLMILSSLTETLPTNINFSAAWNTPENTVPAGWTWGGRAEDLKIQRVDLTPLFHRVNLNPIDINNNGSFAVESGTGVSTTNHVMYNLINNYTTRLTNSWYLKGTAIRLYDTNTAWGFHRLESKAIVQKDTSYVFEDSAWRGELSGRGANSPAPPPASDSYSPAVSGFFSLATLYTNYPSAPNAPSGATTTEALRCFLSFMNNYNFWVKEGFIQGSRTAWTALNQQEPITIGTLDDLIKN